MYDNLLGLRVVLFNKFRNGTFILFKITSSEEYSIKSLLSDCKEITLSNEIKEKTIELRKKYKTKLPDAIIVASAIVKGLPFITADKRFNQIKELNLEMIVLVI